MFAQKMISFIIIIKSRLIVSDSFYWINYCVWYKSGLNQNKNYKQLFGGNPLIPTTY